MATVKKPQTITYKGMTFTRRDYDGDESWVLEGEGTYVHVTNIVKSYEYQTEHRGWTMGSGGPFQSGFKTREAAFDEAIAFKRECIEHKYLAQYELLKRLKKANPRKSRWLTRVEAINKKNKRPSRKPHANR